MPALTYDAVELDRDPSRKDSEASSAQILPTIFYKQQQGKLQEMVDVFLRYRQAGELRATAWIWPLPASTTIRRCAGTRTSARRSYSLR